jgi:hypothetical protein
MARSSGQQRVEPLGGLLAEPRQHVAVDVQRHADGAVPEALLHHLRVNALQEEQRGVGVPQRVERDVGQPGAREELCWLLRSSVPFLGACVATW